MTKPLKKYIRRATWMALCLLLLYITWFLYHVLPVLSAYGAKYLCDGIYLQHRSALEVIHADLSDFPFSLASYHFDENDSSVTGSVWGLAKKKAIYRAGAGVTLISDLSEKETRLQRVYRPQPPPVNADTIPWPQGNLLTPNIPQGLDTARLQLLLRNRLHEVFNDKAANTRAMLVVYDGQLVGEIYAPGYNEKTLLPAWSVTKSITGCLLGILVKQGKLSLDEPTPLASWKGSPKENITLRHLLQQVSGLDYRENYYAPSEATHMLFNCGNAGAYAAARSLAHTPGSVFNYSSGNSNILSLVIRHCIGSSDYAAFPYDSLLYKIGMYSTQLEPDASGTYVGSSYCYATARDYARLGLLYYQNGQWQGEQLLPAGWVQAGTVAPAANPLQNYGYHIWLNGFTDASRQQRVFPSAPADLFYASGYGGQHIFVVPSRKLVLVRLGLRKMDDDGMLKEILDCLPH